MQTIREYAEARGVSCEIVRRQVAKYRSELREHISKKGRTQFLDDYAVEFLDEHRQGKPVAVSDPETGRELDRLREENAQLLRTVTALQQQLLDERARVLQLTEDKAKLLEDKTKKHHWWEFWK